MRPRGSVLVAEGGPPSDFFLVRAGEVRLSTHVKSTPWLATAREGWKARVRPPASLRRGPPAVGGDGLPVPMLHDLGDEGPDSAFGELPSLRHNEGMAGHRNFAPTEIDIGVLGVGDYFGELAIFENMPQAVTATVASSSAELYVVKVCGEGGREGGQGGAGSSRVLGRLGGVFTVSRRHL